MKAKERSSWIGVVALSTSFLTLLSNGYGQTQINLATQGRNVDFTSAPYTKPIRSGTSLPATCSANEFFLNTSAAAGQNLFACIVNSWTLMAAPSGLSDPGANGFVKRTGPNSTAAVPAPSGTVVGTTDTQTLTGKSIDSSEINSGVLTAARMPAFTGDVMSPSGSTNTALATVNQTPGTFGDATHSLQVTVDSKGRVTSLNAFPISGGTSSNGMASTTSALASGALASIPSSCTTGALYLSTDQPTGQQLYICSAANSWTQSLSLGGSGALAFANGSLDVVTSVVPRLGAANHFTGSNQLDGNTTLANVTVTGTCNGCNSSGFANPMSAAGDQIVGGQNGTPTRSAIGAAGQVWTVSSSGQPVWSSLPPPPSSLSSIAQGGSSNLAWSSSDNGATVFDWNNTNASAGGIHNYEWYLAGGNIFLLDKTVIQPNNHFQVAFTQGGIVVGGGVTLNTDPSLTQPACNSGNRGALFFVNGSGSNADSLQVCAQVAGGTTAWKAVF